MKAPKYQDNRDQLYPDLFNEPNQGPPLRSRYQSGFNLPETIRNKIKAGFVPVDFRGKISNDRYEEAVEYGHYKLNLHEYPELKNKVYDDYMFQDTRPEEGETLTYRYGGQICMAISDTNYNNMHSELAEERKRMQAIIDRHKVKQSDTHFSPIQTHYI